MQKLDTILLIDDDYISNYLNQDLISSLRIAYSIPFAHNGREGLDYLKKIILKKDCKISGLILLDLQMPIMDGYEFLFHFNKLNLKSHHNLDLAILTADQKFEKKELMDAALGTYPFLQKPLTEDKILDLLEYLEKDKLSNSPALSILENEKELKVKQNNTLHKKQAFKEIEYALDL